MITKNNLIDMLEKSLANEDEFIVSFGAGFLKDISNTTALSDKEKKDVLSILKALLDDTARHAKTVKRLISTIKEANRNEF